MNEAEIRGMWISERELAWCEANQDVPAARAALGLAQAKREGQFGKEHEAFAAEALRSLREILPRESLRIREVYAYVVHNPLTQVEAIPGKLQGGAPVPLLGFDLARIREMLPTARETQRGMPHPLRLVRFRLDRAVPDQKILYLRSENVKTKTAQEVFAYVATTPSGDEVVLSFRDGKGIERIMAHPNAEEIVAMRGQARTIKATGQRLELRRFVRDGYVEDAEFDLRAEPRPAKLSPLTLTL